MGSEHPVIRKVLSERTQSQETRQVLYNRLEELIGRPVLAFFTSFNQPVMIQDQDVDMIEGVLQKMDLSSGLAVVISSPGGSGLASERLINVCRAYSGTGEYWAIVPSKAKSAATMVCFGASKILMSRTSELGPVDPQLAFQDDEGVAVHWSVYNVVKSYKELFKGAVAEKGNLQPYLQQLGRFDARDIQEYVTEMELSRDISVRALKSGMMRSRSKAQITKKIQVFLTPEQTKSHGRPITAEEAGRCGLNIEIHDVKSEFWSACYELYIRANQFCSTSASKCVETKDHGYSTPNRGKANG